MGRPYFGQPTSPTVPHHLHDNGDAVDGEAVEDIQHGLPAKPIKHEPIDPLGFRWRVPLSWVHNPSGVLALYRDQLDAQIKNNLYHESYSQ